MRASDYAPVKSAYDTALSGLQSAQTYDEAVALKNEAQLNCDKAEKAYNDDKTNNDKKTAWDNAKTALDGSVSAMNKAKRQLDTAQSTFNTCQANLNKVQGS